MKRFGKTLISGMMIMVLAVTMVFTVAEIRTVVFNDPVVLEALGSDGGYVPPTPTPTPVVKKANTLKVSGKTIKVSYSKVKKKNQKFKRAKAIAVSGAKGSVTFKKKKGNNKIVISKSGVVTVKKGLKPGTYKFYVYVKASGNSSYKAATKTAKVVIKVLTVQNPIEVSGKSVKVSGDSLVTANAVIKRSSAISVSKAKGTVTYSKSSGSSYFTVNKKTGNITVKSGTPSGKYTIKVKVIAAGNSQYKKGAEIAKVTITVTEVTPPPEDDTPEEGTPAEGTEGV